MVKYLIIRAGVNHLGIASKEIKSDSDILFKLLNKFGERVISELDGQFALIFWNKKNRTGFAARDFFGQKPLYYRKNMAGIEFASLIKTLHLTSSSHSEIDINQMASIGKNFVCEPGKTFFTGIKEIPPGSIYKIISTDNGVSLKFSQKIWGDFCVNLLKDHFLNTNLIIFLNKQLNQ